MNKLKEKFFNIVLILIIGGLGGVLVNNFLLPYLSTIPVFSKIGFIENIGNGTTIINPTEKITITENIAIEDAIDKIDPCLVAVHSYRGKKLINQGTGFIITSDGLILTAADLISSGTNYYSIYRNNHFSEAKIIKRDIENNLALLKIEEDNLPVVSLADLDDFRLGQRVILTGIKLNKTELNHFINLGTIRELEENFKVNLNEEDILASGSPLININGEVIGLNLINLKGYIKTIPIDKIKEFIGL